MFLYQEMPLRILRTLLFAGCYLLFMAAAGYYIKEFGGDWGVVFQTVFLFGAVVVLAALLFSGSCAPVSRCFWASIFSPSL